MNKIIYYIFYLLSKSPILSVTLDNEFDNIPFKKSKLIEYKDFRYSLISIGFGAKKIYFITYKKSEDNKIQIFKVLDLWDLGIIPENRIVEEKAGNYSRHVFDKNEKNINLEIDFLKYKIDGEENRKNLQVSKINTYTSVMLIIVPIIASILVGEFNILNVKNLITKNSFVNFIIYCVIIYNIINIIKYIWDFNSVKAYNRSMFKDIKKSENHLNALAESYYYDWYNIKNEARLVVSYVKNIELYFKYLILAVSALLITYLICNINVERATNKAYSTMECMNYSKNIYFEDNGKIDKKSLDDLTTIYRKIQSTDLEDIIVISTSSKDINVNSTYKLICESLDNFKSKKANIFKINKNNNRTNKKNFIKIVLIGED